MTETTVMVESWQTSFRKRYSTLFTKGHELKDLVPEATVKIYIVVQRLDDGMLYYWNSEGNESSWPPNPVIPTSGYSVKLMGPNDIYEEQKRRDERRSKRAERKQNTVQGQPVVEPESLDEYLSADWHESPTPGCSSDLIVPMLSHHSNSSPSKELELFADDSNTLDCVWDVPYPALNMYSPSSDLTFNGLLAASETPALATELLTCDPKETLTTHKSLGGLRIDGIGKSNKREASSPVAASVNEASSVRASPKRRQVLRQRVARILSPLVLPNSPV